MQELFDVLPHIPYAAAKRMLLLDTCFVIDMAARRKLHTLSGPVAMTTFNFEELTHAAKHLQTHVKEEIRHFFKMHPTFTAVAVPVHPGEWEKEKRFVNSVEPGLLRHIRDPSDAVLLATAIQTKSDIFTKDKHHLFTAALENYLHQYGIHIFKEWKERE